MKFDETDLQDVRVGSASPRWLDYPREVAVTPAAPGVYILADNKHEVVRIGATSNGDLRELLMSRMGERADRDAYKYRWVVTQDDSLAKELMTEWMRKYKPRNMSAVSW